MKFWANCGKSVEFKKKDFKTIINDYEISDQGKEYFFEKSKSIAYLTYSETKSWISLNHKWLKIKQERSILLFTRVW